MPPCSAWLSWLSFPCMVGGRTSQLTMARHGKTLSFSMPAGVSSLSAVEARKGGGVEIPTPEPGPLSPPYGDSSRQSLRASIDRILKLSGLVPKKMLAFGQR